MPATEMLHTLDPVEAIKAAVGPLDGIDIYHNQVLIGIYQRPEKTVGGIILPDYTGGTRDEDKWQGKVGLILKMGPNALVDPDGVWFKDVDLKVGDWVFFRPSDGWNVTINKVMCRILDDTVIRGKISHPDKVW